MDFFPETGSQTIGFKFDKSLFPSMDYVATIVLTKIFENAVSGEWYDSPASMGFAYRITGDSLFTQIQNFPCGIDLDDTFNISVGGIDLGEFRPGDELKFTDFEDELNDLLVDDIGVEEFTVTGITIPIEEEK